MPQYKLDPEIKQPAYLQLYHQLRDDITGGICPYGTRLPSKRFLAAETGTSVITVQHAYDLLADEGYIESRERSGFFVSYREHELFPAANAAANAAAGRIGTLEMPEIHEISDIPLRGPVVSPEEEQFPFSVLARTARRVLSERGESLLQRSPNSGTIELREAIAQYLARSRRINVLPEQIVIGSGSEYLYNLIVQMLGRDRVFALEDPSYEKIRLVYEASGVQCRMIPMDREGVRLGALGRTEASVLHVTPFNSYPSGITATASRRAGYIRWAAGKDRFIIEDDFDSEFSMSTKAEDTLFSLEPLKSVIYMNTFTRTISPAVRVGYMVLPAELSTAMQEKISFYSCTVPVFTQHMLAELIRSGDFERHINRVRRRRRQAPAR
jgi:GntR family transcriptional regulator/MocR family aminotransferase